MSMPKLRLLIRVCLMALSCGLTLLTAGCGSGNPNETRVSQPPRPGSPPTIPTKPSHSAGADAKDARKGEGREGGGVKNKGRSAKTP